VTVTVAGSARRAYFTARVGGRPAQRGSATRPARLSLSVEPFTGRYATTLAVNGHRLLAVVTNRPPSGAAIGVDPEDRGLPRFSGRARAIGLRAPVCDALARRAHLYNPAIVPGHTAHR
jgi:hypothetical protein